jgi:protein ImuA
MVWQQGFLFPKDLSPVAAGNLAGNEKSLAASSFPAGLSPAAAAVASVAQAVASPTRVSVRRRRGGKAQPSADLRKTADLKKAAGPEKTADLKKTAGPQKSVPSRPPVAPPAASQAPATPPSVDQDIPPLTELERLRGAVRRLEGRASLGEDLRVSTFSSGGEVLDRMLPHGGLRPGTLVEWVSDAQGAGARLLALIAAAQWLAHPASDGRPLVITDGWRDDESFYPPGAISLGIPAERMVIFRKPSRPAALNGQRQTAGRGKPAHLQQARGDLVWAMDQALRSGAVAGVFAEVGDWLSVADARRLQLAAESGGSMLFWVRPTGAAAKRTKSVSVADVRWAVSTMAGAGGRRLRVELVRCRGGIAGASRQIEIDPRFGDQRTGAGDAATGIAGGSGGAVRIREVAMVERSLGGQRDDASTVASDLAGRLADPTPTRPAAERAAARRRVG